LSAEGNHGFLRVIQDQKIAAARVLHDGFEMLEIDEIGAMGLKEAVSGETGFQFLQGAMGEHLFLGGAQIRFAVVAGSWSER
jgi:hypothetical protein